MTPSPADRLTQALRAHQGGRLSEAEQGYRAVLARQGTHVDALYLLGMLLHQQGRAAEALPCLERAVVLADGRADVHNTRGDVLRVLGRPDEAMAAFRAAIARRAHYADAQLNLASTLQLAGRLQEALVLLFEAVAASPQHPALRERLALLLQGVSLGSGSPLVRTVLLALCHDDAIATQTIAGAALGLVQASPAYRAIEAALAQGGDPCRVAPAAVDALAADTLLLAVLPRVLVSDPSIETVLVGLRRALLQRAADDDAIDTASLVPLALPLALLPLAAALAAQCFNTGYSWPVGDDEQVIVDRLRHRLAGLPSLAGAVVPLLGVAMYDTLRPFADRLPRTEPDRAHWPAELQPLLRDQLEAYDTERAIAARLPALTAFTAGVSSQVRAMYEEHPYPRWITLQRPAVTTVAAFIRGLRPDAPTVPAGRSILVAGGGSGQQPIQMALSFPDAEVLSLDLSRASLAYASRMAEHYKVPNVRFGHGDILAIDASLGRFAIVSCSGVLHHLADPLAGWQRLLGVLAPHGVMKVGLYATAARARIDAARAYVRAEAFPPTDAGIRAARQAIRALSAHDPARGVLAFVDFYSTSGARDLLMHVQERSYTLPQIAADLDTLGLRFLGFQLPAPVQARFLAAHPGGWLDLAAWDAFEQAHPDTFAAMYQFWCAPR